MKAKILFFICFISANMLLGQGISREYFKFIKKADSLYFAKDYKNSAAAFSSAFKINGWKGLTDDRYNAACVWALAGYPDSAFFNLERIAITMKYNEYEHLITDSDLNSLHRDKRWEDVINIVKKNKDEAEAKLNKPLIKELDSIYEDDQKYRRQIPEIEKEYGLDSKEMKAHWKIINKIDSINLIQIEKIINEFGWLGKDIIGTKGNATLFLVIQHSNQKTLEKYLPVMRDAVKNGKAYPSDLALLEDRVALGQGKKQIYGSQIITDDKTKKPTIAPIENEEEVDKRRAEVGLEPLAEYVSRWGIKYEPKKSKKIED